MNAIEMRISNINPMAKGNNVNCLINNENPSEQKDVIVKSEDDSELNLDLQKLVVIKNLKSEKSPSEGPAEDLYSLKPDNVILSENSPPVFQYNEFRSIRVRDKRPESGRKSQHEKTEEEIKAYFKRLDEFAKEKMVNFTREDYLKEESGRELACFIAPVIHNRYKDRADMTIVELGPIYTTAVPEALKGNNNRYVSLEMARPYIEKQREFLLANSILAEQTSELQGDLRSMPFKTGSADVIITSCCDPFQCKDKKESIDQMANILKPGGEFIIFPFDLFADRLGEAGKDYLFQRFELAETHSKVIHFVNSEDTRNLTVLRKKSE